MDPMEPYWRLLQGCFPTTLMDRMEGFAHTAGDAILRTSILNPIWVELLTEEYPHVGESEVHPRICFAFRSSSSIPERGADSPGKGWCESDYRRLLKGESERLHSPLQSLRVSTGAYSAAFTFILPLFCLALNGKWWSLLSRYHFSLNFQAHSSIATPPA